MSDTESTELSPWQDRANHIAAWLPTATREELMRFAWRHFQRAESAAYLIAEQIERDQRIAERMASIEISTALDWSEQSRRPTYAELTRRRSAVA